MTDDLVKSHIDWLRGDHEHCNPFIADRIEALTAERDALKTAQIDAIRAALESAAKCCDDEADRCDSAIKWKGGSARYNQDCIPAAYAMRDRSSAIRAIDPAAIAAKLNGEGDAN